MSEETGMFMQQVVKVEYDMQPTPLQRHYGKQMAKRRIIAHKCPECDLVYVPPRGYCPICVVETSEEHEVEIEPKGTITTFTVVNPIQYQGQQEKDVYVLASILLDGASMTIGQQRIGEIPPDEVRTGMRVEAEWASDADGDGGGGRNAMMGSGIAHWGPSGEPDVPLEKFKDHIL